MAKDIRSLTKRSRLAYGFGCIALGGYPLALAVGFVPAGEPGLLAPAWAAAGAGMVFIIGGFMILLADHSQANDFLAGFLLLIFGAVGTWASLFSPSEGIQGGLPFLSRETNVLVGRWVFGLGALISFSLSAWAFRRAAS